MTTMMMMMMRPNQTCCGCCYFRFVSLLLCSLAVVAGGILAPQRYASRVGVTRKRNFAQLFNLDEVQVSRLWLQFRLDFMHKLIMLYIVAPLLPLQFEREERAYRFLLDGGFEVLSMPMSFSMETVPTLSPTKGGFEVLLSMSMVPTFAPTSSPTSEVETPSAKTSGKSGGQAGKGTDPPTYIPTDLNDTSTLQTASLSAPSSSASLKTGPMLIFVAALWVSWCLL
jgi:hypothetical protein